MKIIIGAVVLAISLPVLFVGLVYYEIPAPLPTAKALKQVNNPEASILYDRNQEEISKYYIYDRESVSLDQIPEHTTNALIATEDARFYEHGGVDYRSLMRVFFKTFLGGDESAGGGSTISQQLAKNLYPRQDFKFLSLAVNKVREMIIATRLENINTKESILELYLNTVPFGENVYGVQAASKRFFNKPVEQLDVHESAVLIGMLKANTYYNPQKHPERAKGRRNVVLKLMFKEGYLTGQQRDQYVATNLNLDYTGDPSETESGLYFKDHVGKKVKSILEKVNHDADSNYNIYSSGLKIYTTLDLKMQQYAERAMSTNMRRVQKQFYEQWGNTSPWHDNPEVFESALKSTPQYKRLSKQGLNHEAILKKLSEEKEIEVFTWEGEETRSMSVLDSVKHYLHLLRGGMLAINPVNGHIKAWVGGIDHNYFKYDHVGKQNKRQVGSTFKPFVYATAIENNVSPCTYFKASRATYTENNKEYSPGNADEEYDGKYSLEGALTNSVNTVSVKVLEETGVDKVIVNCRKLGIESDIPPYPSIALGTPGISLFEMASAYGAFANFGKRVEPIFLLKIKNREGEVIWERDPPASTRVFSVETSRVMVEMLKQVVQDGTASRLRHTYNLKNDFAGKTGTTQNNADGWFIGMVPDLVVGVWVGGDVPAIHFKTTSLGQGANTALPAFAQFFKYLNQDNQYTDLISETFPPLPYRLQSKLECDPFKEEFKFFKWLFGKKKKKDQDKKEKDKEGFFKKIGNLFKKKE